MIRFHLKVSAASALLALTLWGASLVHGTTYHVSPFGSNTPPFDTYAKAAADPRDAIESASGFGDTVFIHAGRYDIDTTIDLPQGLSVLAAGAASVSLVSRGFREFETMLRAAGDNEIANLSIENEHFAGSPTIQGFFLHNATGDISIHDCHIVQVECTGTPNGALSFHDNLYEIGSGRGLRTTGGQRSRVFRNRFESGRFSTGATCITVVGTDMKVFDNVFDLRERYNSGIAFEVLESSSSVLDARNNLILGGQFAFSWIFHSGSIENNTIVGTGLPIRIVLDARPHPRSVTIRNNTFVDCLSTPFFTSCEDCDPGATIVYVHNAFWPPDDSLWRPGLDMQKLSITDSANFVGYPMFTFDSLFHLQYGSPLIDTGDPSTLDVDGSRSDIGWTGGPGGVSYAYVDLPPEPPDSLRLSGQGLVTYLSWPRRPEHDLKEYRLYRGDYLGFWHAGLTPIYTLPPSDTDAYDAIQGRAHSVFYVVTAVDSSGHESLPSKEVPYIFSGVSGQEADEPLPRTPSIVRIYPNPFNAATTMEVYIPDVGAMPAPVRISLYDVMGRLVSVSFKGSLNPGNHAIPISATDSQGHALASGVYFARLRVWGTDFGGVKKLVVLK